MNNLSIGKGNKKLGDNILTLSRSVNLSCPNSCVHYDNNCYAEKIERLYPSVKKAYYKNYQIADWQKIRSLLIRANKENKVIRYHVSGDFLREDKLGRKILDKKYINSIKKAYESLKKDKITPPLGFCFTHVLKSEVASLSKYIKIYASVEDTLTYKKAKSAGFKLFAWNSSFRKGKDKTKIFTTETGKDTVVCFEQLGTKTDCTSCGFCFKPHIKLDIAFMQH